MFPINRVVAFAGPYISAVAGAVAAWLVARVNVAGVPGIDEANVATQVAGGLTFALVAALTWLGQSKWLTGHQLEIEQDGLLAASAIAAPPAVPVAAASPEVARTPDVAPAPDPPAPVPTAPDFPPPAEPPTPFATTPDFAPAPDPPAPVPAAPDFPPPPDPFAPFAAAPDATSLLAAPPPPAPAPPAPAAQSGATVVDDALQDEDDDAGDLPDGTPDELRPVMPSEVPFEREPDEEVEP